MELLISDNLAFAVPSTRDGGEPAPHLLLRAYYLGSNGLLRVCTEAGAKTRMCGFGLSHHREVIRVEY